MNTPAQEEIVQTITTHYIDGAFVRSHGREAMDVIRPTDGKVIGRVALGDEEDTRLAIAAAKRAFASFGRTTKEGRSRYLRQLHKAVSARIDDLTAFSEKSQKSGDRKCPGDSDKSFIELPDAKQFLRNRSERVFQQPQGLSRNIKGAHFAVGFDCSYHHLPKGAPL